jgi:hypothetical protein
VFVAIIPKRRRIQSLSILPLRVKGPTKMNQNHSWTFEREF